MDVPVVWSRIGRAAGLLRSGRNHFGFRRIFGGGVFSGSKKLRVERLTAAKRSQQWNVVFFRVFANEGVLPEQVTGNIIILSSDNLFAVVAGVQPRVRRYGLAGEHGSLAHRFAQVDRIVHYSENRDSVAVPNEVLDRKSTRLNS